MDLIKTLENLEPVFIKAGKLALDMQSKVHFHNKYSTGNPVTDIVTDADLAVQEFILEAMTKTDLINCRLLAEESTPSTSKFNELGKLYLGIDPIDDTAIYAKGGKHFSTLISLHDEKNILYMFIYYPAWNWIHKVVNGVYSTEGKIPEEILAQKTQNTIIYWRGDPEKNLPKEILEELKIKGVNYKKVTDFSSDFGSIALFVSGKVAGVYSEDANTYDGLAELSIAEAKGLKIYRGGQNGNLDLTNVAKRDTGLYYPGYYLALNNIL